MKSLKTHSGFRILSLALALLLLFPASAMAADHEPMPAATVYLQSYYTLVEPAGNGKIMLRCVAFGEGVVDEVGAQWMVLHESTDNENFYHVKTFFLEDYPQLMSYNTDEHSSILYYQGVPGRYYKVYTYVWAGSDGEGDIRYCWSNVTQAI